VPQGQDPLVSAKEVSKMKNWLQSLDKNILALLRTIGQKAEQKNFAAFVVGGYVRDVILKRKNFDLDIVVEADAVPLAQEFSREFGGSLIVYKQFMTATVVLPDGLLTFAQPRKNIPESKGRDTDYHNLVKQKSVRVDFVTARKEFYPHPGALPVVRAGSIHDDLFRRDFTINAMAVSIHPRTFGQLRDDFGGYQDLQDKKIRILHPQSFRDDPTRILRAVRFEQRSHFRIEKHSLSMLKLALKNDAVSLVKPPRYFDEFKKILSEEHPQKFLRRLWKLGALGFLELKSKNFSQTLKLMHRIEGQIIWFEEKIPRAKAIERWLPFFMVLADGLSADRLRHLFKKFHFKKEDQLTLLSCVKIPSLLKSLRSQRIKPSEVFAQLKSLSYETILFSKAKARHRTTIKHIEDFLLTYDSKKLTINGRDLNRLGIPPGKQMGIILNNILCAKIDGELKTQEEELSKAEELFDRRRQL